MSQPTALTAFVAIDVAALDELVSFARDFTRLAFSAASPGEFVAHHESGLDFRISGSGFGDGATGPAITGIVERISVHGAEGERYEIAGLGVPLHELVRTFAVGAVTDCLADLMTDGAIVKGSPGDDQLVGFGGSDTLGGGKGRDRLHGGPDADSFVFSVKVNRKHADRIDDFEVGLDRLVLDSEVFARIGSDGHHLKAKKFVVGDSPTKSSHRVVYNDDNGKLYYDKDGKEHGSGMVLIAKLDEGLDLDHRDLFVL